MRDFPWLTVIGMGEDGLEGLTEASRKALFEADIVMAPKRHLEMIGSIDIAKIEWPVPFADGIPQLLDLKGQNVAVLASGDPFWFGSGSVLTRHLDTSEWRAFPATSCFSVMANRLGWRLETTACLGLHAKPMSRLRPYLSNGRRIIVTLRDGDAVENLTEYLCQQGFDESKIHIGQSLGGESECVSAHIVKDCTGQFAHPLCAAIDVVGSGGLPVASGLPDGVFDHDGQITKRPMRALAMSALAPKYGELLWDIGGGSGSISIEWLLSDISLRAICIERDMGRADTIRDNARGLGVEHLNVVTGAAPNVLDGLETPNAVFIGGGLSKSLLEKLRDVLPKGTRLVAHAVTLESESVLAAAQAEIGGSLMRIELAESNPIGRLRGWKSSYPVVQWSAVL